jgi:hypothetical protein
VTESTTYDDNATPGRVLPGPRKERIDQLHARFRELDDAAKSLKEQLDAVKDALKAELTSIVGADGRPLPAYALPLGDTLTYQVSKRLDTKTFDAAYPGLRAQFSNATGAWVLRRAK